MAIFSHGFVSELIEQRRYAEFEKGQKEADTLSSVNSTTANTIKHQFYCHFVAFKPVSVLNTLQEEVLYLNAICIRSLDFKSNQ